MADASVARRGPAPFFSTPAEIAAALIVALTLFRALALVADPLPLSVDEAQYWIWAQDPALGYFSKPPMIAWLIALTTSFCGNGEPCVRIAAPVLHAANAAVVYWLAATLYDQRAALWSALTFVLLPGVSASAMIISTDVPLLLFWALALLCFIQALATQKRAWWIGLGLAVGLGLLSKYAMAMFIPCAAIYLMWQRPKFRALDAALSLVFAALIYAPNIYWNIRNGFASYGHAQDNIIDGTTGLSVLRAGAFLGEQFGVFGPITMLALLMAGWGIVRGRDREPRDVLLFCFSVPVVAVVTLEGLFVRAYANWAAVAYVAGTVLVANWMLRWRPWLIRAAVGLHAVVAALVIGGNYIVEATGTALPRALDPAARLRGWDRMGPWIMELRRANPDAAFLFDERQIMASAIYYGRPLAWDAVLWNPTGVAHNHFELITDAGRHVGQDLLYVSRNSTLEWVEGTFAEGMLLSQWATTTHPGHRIELHAHLLKKFSGYRP